MAIDWKAYWQGQKDCRIFKNDTAKIKNPYLVDTLEWKSWNLGWNAVDFEEFNGANHEKPTK